MENPAKDAKAHCLHLNWHLQFPRREVSFWWPLISGASSIPGCQGVKSLKDVLEKALGVGKY